MRDTLEQLKRWPSPERYRATPGRPAVLFLQYSMVTGGAGCYIQRLADGVSDIGCVDVAAYLPGEGDPVGDLRSAAWLPAGSPAEMLTHCRWADYRYVDTAFPLREQHLDWIESILQACPNAALGVRLHSEMCFIRHYKNIRSRRLLQRAAVIYVHHERMRRELLEFFADKSDNGESAEWADRVVVLPPGVDVERFTTGLANSPAARSYAADFDLYDAAGRKRLVVAMAGRPSLEKNWLDYAILCRRLKNLHGDKLVCLAITGRQRGLNIRRHGCLDEFVALNRTLGAPCRITGLVSDFQNLLASVDVYVQLSSTESFCRTAAEASACGIPVVATGVGGLAEIVVDDGVTGHLVPVGAHRWCRRLTSNERATASWYVTELLSGENHRRAMGGAGRRRTVALMDDADSIGNQAIILRRLLAPATGLPACRQAGRLRGTKPC